MAIVLLLTVVLIVLFTFLYTLQGISEGNKDIVNTFFAISLVLYILIVVFSKGV